MELVTRRAVIGAGVAAGVGLIASHTSGQTSPGSHWLSDWRDRGVRKADDADRGFEVASYSIELELQSVEREKEGKKGEGKVAGASDEWWVYLLDTKGVGEGWRRSWEQVKSITECLDKAFAAKRKVTYRPRFETGGAKQFGVLVIG